MILPNFITFTGVDEWTDEQKMVDLSKKYSIEWGILFSPFNQGKKNRYPALEHLKRFLDTKGLRFSAHLCGKYSTSIMNGIIPELYLDNTKFSRSQINSVSPDIKMISAFSNSMGIRCIAQTRGKTFPKNSSIDWLYDTSGGRGQEPENWPKFPNDGRLVGYAGGIGPDNVLGILEKINARGRYWIDMESKIRTDDKLDLDLCEEVCRKVYDR